MSAMAYPASFLPNVQPGADAPTTQTVTILVLVF
jgi:hypothetical protein